GVTRYLPDPEADHAVEADRHGDVTFEVTDDHVAAHHRVVQLAAAGRDQRVAVVAVGCGWEEGDEQVPPAGHLHQVPGAVLSHFVHIVDGVAGQLTVDVEHDPVVPVVGVRCGADPEQPRHVRD